MGLRWIYDGTNAQTDTDGDFSIYYRLPASHPYLAYATLSSEGGLVNVSYEAEVEEFLGTGRVTIAGGSSVIEDMIGLQVSLLISSDPVVLEGYGAEVIDNTTNAIVGGGGGAGPLGS